MDDTKLEPLSADEAIAMLPDGPMVHTFRGSAFMALGADWPRQAVMDAIRTTDRCERAGPMATAIGHGLVIAEGGRPLFIATRRAA